MTNVVRTNLDELARACYSAVFSDVCDRLNMRNQTLDPGVVPHTSNEVLVGWARTARVVPADSPPARPYGAEIDYVDSLRGGEVPVIDATGVHSATWGELFSAAAIGRGARGAVVDGMIRDRDKILELGFPVFARGVRPSDCLGRSTLEAQDVEIRVGGVRVCSGDLIVADGDGITVVPYEVVGDAIPLAFEKVRDENRAKELLLEGATLKEAWERFRVL